MALADDASGAKTGSAFPEIVELNVGGQVYLTRHSTLLSVPGSLLWEMFTPGSARPLARDGKNRVFVDRDGFLFRYILDYLRDHGLVLPENFPERSRLRREAEYFKLSELARALAPEISELDSDSDGDTEDLFPTAAAGGPSTRIPGFITIAYRGSYTLGRDGPAEGKFRRVARIMVCGRTALAKEVFGEALNESRDPDRAPERYTSRYYLKFTFLEQAFDRLAGAGFHMVASNSAGTCATPHELTDGKVWSSYTEYVFCRPPAYGQDSPKASEDLKVPGSLWLSLAPAGTERNGEKDVRKYLASTSEPILDLQMDVTTTMPADAVSATENTLTPTLERSPELSTGGTHPTQSEPPQSPEATTGDPDPPFPPPPDQDPLSGAGSSGSLLWPEAPGEHSPPWPTTSDFKPLKTPQEAGPTGQVWRNGLEGGGPSGPAKKAIQSELGKCIEDFRKIKVPVSFPDKKRPWQDELLRKYCL